MALVQLGRISSAHPLPRVLLMNYDGVYRNLLAFMADLQQYGETG